jgi:ABC-type multidrug transport system fused ATPase/permease subunit
MSTRHQKEHPIECDGFFEGSNGTRLETGIEKIQAQFDNQRTELQKNSVTKAKHLEAELEHLDAIKPDADRQWAAILQSHGDQIPSVAMPVIVAFIGILALLAEARMLAPALDLLNVTDYSSQLLSALGISFITALAFHFAWETFTREDFPRLWKLAVRVMAGALSLGMICWGILRGLQVGFSADLAQSPLGEFLRNHPVLSSAFYVLITLAVPVIAATASHYSQAALERWWRWHKVSRQVKDISKRRAYASKLLESERETLSHGLKQLEHQAKEAKALYARSHERGVQNGTIQEQYWTVFLKSTLAAIVALITFGWFIFVISPFFALIPVAVWIGAFFHYRRQWRSPNPAEFFDLERVRFAIAATDAKSSELPITARDVRSTLREGREN